MLYPTKDAAYKQANVCRDKMDVPKNWWAITLYDEFLDRYSWLIYCDYYSISEYEETGKYVCRAVYPFNIVSDPFDDPNECLRNCQEKLNEV